MALVQSIEYPPSLSSPISLSFPRSRDAFVSTVGNPEYGRCDPIQYTDVFGKRRLWKHPARICRARSTTVGGRSQQSRPPRNRAFSKHIQSMLVSLHGGMDADSLIPTVCFCWPRRKGKPSATVAPARLGDSSDDCSYS